MKERRLFACGFFSPSSNSYITEHFAAVTDRPAALNPDESLLLEVLTGTNRPEK